MNEQQAEPILTVRGAVMRFPGTLALDSVDLDIYPGEVVALLGENGAGKSTLAKIIAGVQAPTAGVMTWLGKPYEPGGPADAIGNGIGMIHQEMQLLPDLTVAENCFVGRWPMKAGRLDQKAMSDAARAKLAELGFERPMSTLVRELSVAGQQQVEIARALLMDTRLLILDEPTAALGDDETEALFDCVRQLQREGVSFIYVSHRLAEIAKIATRIVVLRDGEWVASHDRADVPTEQLVAEMVGRSVERLFPPVESPREEIVLSVRGLSAAGGFVRDIDFDVHAGEVFGIAGLVGAGRTELVRAIAGADPSAHGAVTVAGGGVRAHSVAAAVAKGLVMIPEDRKQQGVIVPMTIHDNLVLPNFDRVSSAAGWVLPSRTKPFTQAAIAEMGVKGKAEWPVGTLSGGNQQKVVLGKWLARSPRVVVLDEPTRGIDVGARAAIYEVIAGLSREGVAVIVVSSDLEEVLGLSHRVMVLSRGESRGILPRDEATAERVMHLATH
ncbi:MAG: sugar ABC transporter ATP-binding protein [Propionicimonas sp.]